MQGEQIEAGGQTIEVREEIPQGHKIAVDRIRSGAQVIKYGFPIGHATEDVEAGSWVHTHNMATNLEGETACRYEPDLHLPSRWNRRHSWDIGDGTAVRRSATRSGCSPRWAV